MVGAGVRHAIAKTIEERWPDASRAWIGIDEHAEPFLSDITEDRALRSRFDVRTRAIPHGEASKSLAGVSGLYDWMIDGGVRRGDVAIALGGGMVGDLMGFAAATVLRGIGLVQVPTTLLSMVDSSVGGKTGINHPGGKNLIGAFHQAARVLIDPELLATLPEREFRSGWAEIVKHAVIQPSTPGGEDGALLSTLERNVHALRARRSPLLDWVIRQNVALKAAVVTADERESSLRAILNFGHTIGHAIEAADYRLLHGEAIAVGMRAALLIAGRLALLDAADVDRVTALLDAFGLPATATADPAAVRARLRNDKKVSGGRQTWVLPVRAGGVTLTQDVPEAAIEEALAAVLAAAPAGSLLEPAGR
jgi:3-dehydroquinate synthase